MQGVVCVWKRYKGDSSMAESQNKRKSKTRKLWKKVNQKPKENYHTHRLQDGTESIPTPQQNVRKITILVIRKAGPYSTRGIKGATPSVLFLFAAIPGSNMVCRHKKRLSFLWFVVGLMTSRYFSSSLGTSSSHRLTASLLGARSSCSIGCVQCSLGYWGNQSRANLNLTYRKKIVFKWCLASNLQHQFGPHNQPTITQANGLLEYNCLKGGLDIFGQVVRQM